MKKIITSVLLALGMLVPMAVTSAPQASAEINLVKSGRCQMAGPANQFWDIYWEQYQDGIVNVNIDLYSNVPRVRMGNVAFYHTWDWAVPQNCRQGSYYAMFDMCPNLWWDQYDFYSSWRVSPYENNYGVEMEGTTSGDWAIYTNAYPYYIHADGWYTISDSRVHHDASGWLDSRYPCVTTYMG